MRVKGWCTAPAASVEPALHSADFAFEAEFRFGESKYPTFEVSGFKSHCSYECWSQKLQIVATWTLSEALPDAVP